MISYKNFLNSPPLLVKVNATRTKNKCQDYKTITRFVFRSSVLHIASRVYFRILYTLSADTEEWGALSV